MTRLALRPQREHAWALARGGDFAHHAEAAVALRSCGTRALTCTAVMAEALHPGTVCGQKRI
ncbi:MAG: hypothetical protein EB107_15455, partial [Proteobacteria bacterium]|nr:hypothetical protein [Pseudomonadota bacterium]